MCTVKTVTLIILRQQVVIIYVSHAKLRDLKCHHNYFVPCGRPVNFVLEPEALAVIVEQTVYNLLSCREMCRNSLILAECSKTLDI